jgi:eukaryotic-like serine/threonine-protein kinase
MTISSVEALSDANQTRVAEILESCLIALENGSSFEPEALIAANPDIAEPLQKCLTSLVTLHEAVHGPDDTLPNHPNLSVGGRLGDFVIEELIGRGGMGVVYSAVQVSLNRRVAIKLLPNSHLLPPMQLQRFQLEAKAIASLQHANIVPIYSVGNEAGLHYYAMQLIEGHSLDKLEKYDWSQGHYRGFLDAALALTDALSHAHAGGIIHRDIKPSNLLLDAQGKVWITDFGLARCQNETRLTLTGDLLGTVNYMSPEQSLGKPVDERTDIYSLGVTLYEMLCGKQAFPGNARPAVLRQIENQQPQALRKLKPDIPYDLETVIIKAISKDREDRYSNAAVMLADLQAVRDGRPIAGRRPGIARVVSRWAAKHKAVVSVAMLGLVATMMAVVAGSVQVLLTQRKLESAQAESQIHQANAEKSYWQGRNLIEHWNRNLIRRLADIPGAEVVHSQMLTDTIGYYQSFLEKSATDPELAVDIAAARVGLAAALDQSGDTAKSVQTYCQAINDIEKFDQRDADNLRQLALARNDLAVVLLRSDRAAEAAEQLQLASNNLQAIESGSGETEYLAAIEVNLARAFQLLGRRQDEETSLDRAEDMYRTLLAKQPDKADLTSELATVLDHRALLHAGQHPQAALNTSQAALMLHRRCMATVDPPSKWRQRLGASLHNHAVLSLQHNAPDVSRQHFLEAIEVKQSLAERFPHRQEQWEDLAISFAGLGRLEYQCNNWMVAQENFNKAYQSLTHLSQNSPAAAQQLAIAEALISLLESHLNAQNQLLTGEPTAQAVLEARKRLSDLSKLTLTPSERDELNRHQQRIAALEPSDSTAVSSQGEGLQP